MALEKIKKLLHRHKYIELFPAIPLSGAKMCYTCGKFAVYNGSIFLAMLNKDKDDKVKIESIELVEG